MSTKDILEKFDDDLHCARTERHLGNRTEGVEKAYTNAETALGKHIRKETAQELLTWIEENMTTENDDRDEWIRPHQIKEKLIEMSGEDK